MHPYKTFPIYWTMIEVLEGWQSNEINLLNQKKKSLKKEFGLLKKNFFYKQDIKKMCQEIIGGI